MNTAVPDYPDVELFVGGRWRPAASGATIPVTDPSSGDPIGAVAHAERPDFDAALEAVQAGFECWREVSAFDRYKLMRKAADLLRARADSIAPLLTLEQGKPLAEAKAEALAGADVIDWFAEEGRRAYGRTIPSRAPGVVQFEISEPVGPVAAFTPWNFPINQAVRKISGALAAGCAIIIKGPEETPASCAALVAAFADAGLPPGVINLLYGVPAEVSSYLIPHPVIRKVSFTGSTTVGKQLAMLAGQHMKRVTMELGGHAPVIVFADADIDAATRILAAGKYRNAGQVCASPTRFLVEEPAYDTFVSAFVSHARSVKVGNGFSDGVQMGPLANSRRLDAMESLVADAVDRGATVETGGKRVGNKGYFFEPTVLTDVPREARVMNEEPFGPIAVVNSFARYADAVSEANRLPYGLAAFAYTRSGATAGAIARDVQSGMMSINHQGLALPEVPFGGIKDSGYGSEGGADAIAAYLNMKFVTHFQG